MTKISTPNKIEYGFQFNPKASPSWQEVQLSDLADLPEWEKVSVTAKVVKIHPEKSVTSKQGSKLRVANVVICDTSGQMQLDAWESHIDQIQEGSSYQMTPVQVKKWSGSIKLSTVMQTKTTKVDKDEQQKLEVEEMKGDDTATVVVKQIDSIRKMEKLHCCMHCMKPIIQISASTLARCDRCGTTMHVADCSESYRLRFTIEPEEKDMIPLLVYENALCDMVDGKTEENEIMERLLTVQDIAITYNTNNNFVIKIE